MGFLTWFSSLRERASVQVAINLCQQTSFKEAALCLEKPTYGVYMYDIPSAPFISNPEEISIWTKIKEAEFNAYGICLNSRHLIFDSEIEQWDGAVEEQREKLIQGLPYLLRPQISIWIRRIALEYLSYSRRLEYLCGISRYFLMAILTIEDWTEAGQFDEEKLAMQWIQDERLTVMQRYRVACTYCLYKNIPELWMRLTKEEQQLIRGSYRSYDPNLSQGKDILVFLWSINIDACHDQRKADKIRSFWTLATKQAVCYGNRVALMSCWNKLKKGLRQKMLIDLALQSVQIWQSIQSSEKWRDVLLLYKYCSNLPMPLVQFDSVEFFNLPSYYTELVQFFLSQMNEGQRTQFFYKAIYSFKCNSVLECLLDFPHYDIFLSAITRLWGVVDMDKYGECLLTIATRYSGDCNGNTFSLSFYEENCFYDYRSLLWSLWAETPEEYRRYLFIDKKLNNSRWGEKFGSEGKIFLPQLLKKSPFKEKDEELFKQIWLDLQKQEKYAVMKSKAGETICSLCIQKEKWSFLDWLLTEFIPKDQIPDFKKYFVESDGGQKLCVNELKKHDQKLLVDIINWCFTSDAEKEEFKYNLIFGKECLSLCKILFIRKKFDQLDHMMDFCLTTDKQKKQFKLRVWMNG